MSPGPLGVRFNGASLDAAAAATLAAGRALHYGDGVFRTLLRLDGRVDDLDGQLRKLAHDAARLGLSPVPPATLAEELEAAASGHAEAVLKLVLSRRGAARGYRSDDSGTDRLAFAYPLTRYPSSCWTVGVVAFRSPVSLATQPRLAGIKHLNRLEQVLAAREWQDGADEGILCDDAGRPVCGTRSNLFWVRGGGLHSAALDRAGVAGRMRDRVIEAAAASGIALQLGAGHWDELMDADEAFLTNSLIGIWPLRELDARRWSSPGPVTRRLAAALDHPRLSLR